MQTVLDRTSLPSVVNTQILNPLKNTDPAVKIAFPGVNVGDREQANVRPPHPSLCVGNGFIIETTDLVSWHCLQLMAWEKASLGLLSNPHLSEEATFLLQSEAGSGSDAYTAGMYGLLWKRGGCLQAFKVYNIKGEILAGPVSLVDFFGQSVTGSFSDTACKQGCPFETSLFLAASPCADHLHHPSIRSRGVAWVMEWHRDACVEADKDH